MASERGRSAAGAASMTIILARHGRPAMNQTAWIAPRDLARWIAAWNEADVAVEDLPPPIQQRAAESGVLASSALKRGAQSAKIVGGARVVVADPIFDEASLPYPQTNLSFPALPLSLWAALLRVAWCFGYSSNAESRAAATKRARDAAARLVELATQHGSVIVVGHGIMSMLIARQLTLQGWSGQRRPRLKYWGLCAYVWPIADAKLIQ
jgi:broad specificity phosphatase PhoE